MMLHHLIREVCELQLIHSESNTAAMTRRGQIVRHGIPDQIRPLLPLLAREAGLPEDDMLLVGKDGAGRKAHVPWVRVASRVNSPAPTRGWYVVYLWPQDGRGVYLALAHSSSDYRAGSFVPKATKELDRHVWWARDVLKDVLVELPHLSTDVLLSSRTRLALAYEKSCPIAHFYPVHDIPSDDSLFEHLAQMMGILARIYEADRLGKLPQSQGPEVRDIERIIQEIARPQRSKGKGPGLTAEERRAVEIHAVKVATIYLTDLGYTVEDVGSTESYDLRATKDSGNILIEVKGTTGGLGKIVLTANEVRLHKGHLDKNGLIVVHNIGLDREDKLRAFGGAILARIPWALAEDKLRPIAYSYDLTTQDQSCEAST